MKILVTGGAGYLGSVLVRLLLGRGHDVRVLDSLMYGKAPIDDLYFNENFELIQGDVRSPETVAQALSQVDAVVHLAAIVGDPACSQQPDLARSVNLDASIQLFRLARQQAIERFVFASTCSNYGKMQNASDYATEESELRPVSLYAETKVGVERALLDGQNRGRPIVTVLRLATIFGISPRMRFDLTVNEFTMKLFVERKLSVYGEQFWRPYIHVQDAARAIGRVLEVPGEKINGQVFNVGDTTQNFPKKQLVDMICAQMEHRTDVEYIHKEEDPRDYRVSFEKIRRKLGFQTTRTVDDGIREIMSMIRQGTWSDFNQACYSNVGTGAQP